MQLVVMVVIVLRGVDGEVNCRDIAGNKFHDNFCRLFHDVLVQTLYFWGIQFDLSC